MLEWSQFLEVNLGESLAQLLVRVNSHHGL